jgi:serine/threonine protein kinase
VIEGDYTSACDLWSIGIMVYLMLMGKYPFTGIEITELFENI